MNNFPLKLTYFAIFRFYLISQRLNDIALIVIIFRFAEKFRFKNQFHTNMWISFPIFKTASHNCNLN